MRKINLTMPVSSGDVEQFASIMEMEDDGNYLHSFAERFLRATKNSCEEIRKEADRADSYNPFCMEKVN